MSQVPNLAANLARKAKQVLDTKTDDATLLQSLTALSTLDRSDAHQTLPPHQLQAAVESNGVRSATHLLSVADDVLLQLALLQKSVQDLRGCTTQIRHDLEVCRSQTQPYLNAVEHLNAAAELNREKEHLIGEFLTRYQLLPEEATQLESGDVTTEFFRVLQRAQNIHANCKSLLRTQHQRAGLELMDTMARYQEMALKRLVDWIQLKCQELLNAEAAELDPLMQEALQALSTRPVLYRYCAEEVAGARHDALFERFVGSLSLGPRPIEMQSDDPKRYLNDMLAWVHQSLASEIELLELLFRDIRRGKEAEEDLPTVTDLMNRIFRSIDRPLKVRIEQVLMTPPSPVLCFELGCLLEFYVGVMRDVTGEGFELVGSLQSCLDMCVRTLHEQIHARGVRLMRHAFAVPRDLTPPTEVTETIQFLLQFLNVHASALKAPESREGLSIDTIASNVIDPLLQTCDKCAAELTGGTLYQDNPLKLLISKKTFLINCTEALVTSLRDRPVIQQKWKALGGQLEADVASFAEETAQMLLQQCQMAGILDRIQEYWIHGSDQIAQDPSLSLEALSRATEKFFVLISTPDSLPEFAEIVDVEIKHTLATQLANLLAGAYDQVYGAACDPRRRYGEAADLGIQIEHTPEHTRTILGLR